MVKITPMRRSWWRKFAHTQTSIKFLLVLTNATGGDWRVDVGLKRPMKIGWSDNQESVELEPVLIGKKSVAWQRLLNSQY